ncbi:MAG: ATPase [Planctomycetota bacterium]|nr:MAG: ATPase [Planctomycetota bacterium]
MHVILVEPAFPSYQRQFARALHQVGARVTGIGERPLEALDEELCGWLDDYIQIGSVVDEGALLQAVRAVQAVRPVHRLEATIEAHIMPAAHVREAAGIPGTSTRTAFLCRDKPAMKAALREAGVPCAQSTGADNVDDVLTFARSVGYPLIIKPRAAAGASGTHRADNETQLLQVLHDENVHLGAEVAVEEFIEGHEGFWDTLTLNGEVMHEFVCHYFPNVLHAMRTRWVSPQIVCTNRLDDASYNEVKALGRKVIDVLGIETSATHMEWFFGPKGLKFSEIGCRPPGVATWDMYSAANDMDIYREWAHLIVHGAPEQQASRRYTSGMVALRPDRDGVISSVDGADELQQQWAEHLIDAHFPAPGQGTQPVEAGYMANAWVRLRHPDYDTLRGMLDRVGERVQVHAR